MVTVLPTAVTSWCTENGWGPVVSSEALTGGMVSRTERLTTSDNRSLILKSNSDAPADIFAREAEGLGALTVSGGPRIPTVFLVGSDLLLLEDLQPTPPQPHFWEEFGQRLAALHLQTGTQYGFSRDNYCGVTPQPNPWTESGCEFFAEYRLRYQARLAHDKGHLSTEDLRRAETLCERLPDLVPPQSPALIHGDLWSGNALCGPNGEPALIDPAAHFGWAEAELGMTLLFGGFPRAFYDAYLHTYPLAPGWRERVDIYNLYHLLNHLHVFGQSYLGRVQSVLKHYE